MSQQSGDGRDRDARLDINIQQPPEPQADVQLNNNPIPPPQPIIDQPPPIQPIQQDPIIQNDPKQQLPPQAADQQQIQIDQQEVQPIAMDQEQQQEQPQPQNDDEDEDYDEDYEDEDDEYWEDEDDENAYEEYNKNLVDHKGPQKHSLLHSVISNNNISWVKCLLQASVAKELIKSVDGSGKDPILFAAYNNKLEMLKLFVQYLGDSFDGTLTDKRGLTLLHCAMYSDNVELIEYVLTLSQLTTDEINTIVDGDGNTVLQYAAYHGKVHAVKHLIKNHSCNLFTHNYQQYNILHSTIHGGNIELCDYIFENDTERKLLHEQNVLGIRPLFTAISKQHLPILQHLAEKHNIDLNIEDIESNTLLHHAASNNDNIDLIRYIVSKQPNLLHAANQLDYTPIFTACYRNQLDVVKYFITECNIPVIHKLTNGQNLMHIAARYGNEEMVKYLGSVNEGIVNTREDNGERPIHIAAQYNTPNVFKALLSVNADVLATNDFLQNAMHFAVLRTNYYDMLGMFRCVKESFAFVNGLTTSSYQPVVFGDWDEIETPLLLAVREHKLNSVKVLITNGFDININGNSRDIFHTAIEFPDPQHSILNYLVSQEAKFNATSGQKPGTTTISDPLGVLLEVRQYPYGLTPLFTAAARHDIIAMKLLIQRGAKITQTDNRGRNLFHVIASNIHNFTTGFIPMIDYLIELGISFDTSDESGYTPLLLACKFAPFEVVQKLIQLGAKCESITDKGQYILHLAAKNKRFNIIDQLLKLKPTLTSYLRFRDNYEYTPLLVASSVKKLHKQQRINSMNDNDNNTVQTTSQLDNDDITALLNHGSHLYEYGYEDGYTLLHTIVKNRDDVVDDRLEFIFNHIIDKIDTIELKSPHEHEYSDSDDDNDELSDGVCPSCGLIHGDSDSDDDGMNDNDDGDETEVVEVVEDDELDVIMAVVQEMTNDAHNNNNETRNFLNGNIMNDDGVYSNVSNDNENDNTDKNDTNDGNNVVHTLSANNTSIIAGGNNTTTIIGATIITGDDNTTTITGDDNSTTIVKTETNNIQTSIKQNTSNTSNNNSQLSSTITTSDPPISITTNIQPHQLNNLTKNQSQSNNNNTNLQVEVISNNPNHHATVQPVNNNDISVSVSNDGNSNLIFNLSMNFKISINIQQQSNPK